MLHQKDNQLQENENQDYISNIFKKNDPFFELIKKCRKNLLLKIFYYLLLSKPKRKILERRSTCLQKLVVADQWRKFIDLYMNDQLEKFDLKAKKYLHTEKIIWQYWAQGIDEANLPPLVQSCFNSVDRYKGSYKVIRLDINTVKDYLDIPDFVWERKKNPQFVEAFFSDLVRLALLKNYGGVWIDATILLTQPISEEILEQDLFFFQRTKKTPNKDQWERFNNDYFGWSSYHKVNILNSFIVSKKNNSDIGIYLDLMLNYWKTQQNIPEYFFFQIMVNELIEDGVNQHKKLVLDDTLPHLLQVQLEQKMDEDIYQNILNQISIHKLNRRTELKPDTFSTFIIKQFQPNQKQV